MITVKCWFDGFLLVLAILGTILVLFGSVIGMIWGVIWGAEKLDDHWPVSSLSRRVGRKIGIVFGLLLVTSFVISIGYVAKEKVCKVGFKQAYSEFWGK